MNVRFTPAFHAAAYEAKTEGQKGRRAPVSTVKQLLDGAETDHDIAFPPIEDLLPPSEVYALTEKEDLSPELPDSPHPTNACGIDHDMAVNFLAT